MWTFFLWNFVAFAAAVYCITKAMIDLRSHQYVWGIVGLVSAGVFLLTPVQANVVKIDQPAARS